MSNTPEKPEDIVVRADRRRDGRHIVVASFGDATLSRDTIDLNSDIARKRFVGSTLDALPNLNGNADAFRKHIHDFLLKLAAAPPGASAPEAAPVESDGSAMPQIVANGRQYRHVEDEALNALVAANVPPSVFVGNGCGLVDLRRDEPDAPLAAREFDGPSIRTVLARVADWFEQNERGEMVDAFPPTALLASFPVRGDWPGIPYLRSVVTYPVFGPRWVLNATPGYHPDSFIYCDLGDLAVPAVAAKPTDAQVRDAVDLIVNELLGDFPFVGEEEAPNASRANAVGMLLLPIIRPAIDGPTPLGLIDAPAEGTGKSLLAEVVTLVTIGDIPEAVSPDMSDEEWNKTLLAMLIEGQPVIYLDNANRKVDSASFASALTAKYKKGRVLGETRIARARINVCWILTANNFECSKEIARRIYWIRIDRGVETPASAEVQYRHPDLHAWVREKRPELLAALITLVNNWLAKGKPPGSATLPKFEAWAKTVGGILEVAGVKGFLQNADEFRKTATNQASEMPEFVAKWYERHSSTKVIASELFDIAEGLLESVLTANDERGRKTQLGKFLRTQRGRVYGEFKIKFCTKADGKDDCDHSGRPRYQLEKIKTPNKPAPAAEPAKSDEYTFENGIPY